VRALLPVVVAGSAFAGFAILGLACGALVASRYGQPLYAPAGLVLGAALGGYCALRIVARAMR
jgi:hypothetical protein